MAPAPASSKSHSRQHTGPPANVASSQDESRYMAKYKALKEKVSVVEADNLSMHTEIIQTKRQIQRLRIERAILYERLHASKGIKAPPPAPPSSSTAPAPTTEVPEPVQSQKSEPAKPADPVQQPDQPSPSRGSSTSIPSLLNPADAAPTTEAAQNTLEPKQEEQPPTNEMQVDAPSTSS